MRSGSWITDRVYVEREHALSRDMDLVTIHIGGRTVAAFLCEPADAARIEGLAKVAQDTTALRQAWDEGAEATHEAIAEDQLEWSRVDSEWRGRFPSNPYQP